ncbi:MAG: ribosome biogenesis GTPase YlqF [Pseudomonadales bacterium]|jgi:ribosome biogenesis GTPase A
MTINWFPGHMHKATKEIKQRLPSVDLIIEVLDARIPYSSANPVIAKLRGDKPCIKLLNKSDLADPEVTKQWIAHFEQDKSVRSMAVTSHKPDQIRAILNDIRNLFADNFERGRPIHIMITGIPNVGKSTIINILAQRIIAKTGNEPAVTKGQQKINLPDGLYLWDTPGILWGKFHNQAAAYRLATTGAIKETAVSNDDIAAWAAEYLLRAYPEALVKRYELAETPRDEIDFLEQAGKRRGCISRGNQIDFEKIAKIFLTEYRDATLGLLSLETPQMAEAEEAEVEAKLAAEAEAKDQKKKQRKRR